MTDEASVVVHGLGSAGRGATERAASWRSYLTRRWDLAVLVIAAVSTAAALWITLDAHFLEYPGWLAIQKADFILGPIGVGLYWHHRRPDNRLELLLIGLGLVGVFYILESSTVPALFAIGLITEAAICRPERLVIALVVLGVVPLTAIEAMAAPHVGPSFSISGCGAACPPNGLAIWPAPSWLPTLSDVQGGLLVAIPIATGGVLVWRFLTATPPRRRALAIGAPVALLFLVVQAAYRALFLFALMTCRSPRAPCRTRSSGRSPELARSSGTGSCSR